MDTPHDPAPTSPALVGRDRELAALRDALAGACAGRGSLVLIGGEAGIGKTALAEWLCAEAQGQGALVLVGRCYDLAETPPYGPWAEALATRTPDTAGPLAPPDLAGGGMTSQAALFAAVRDHLAALAARRPVVLLLDDLHWADPASLDLLRVIGRGLGGMALLVLAAYRADEIARAHPLHALLPLLVRETSAARLDLRPLDAAAIGALVAARYALGAADAARLVGYLAGRTEGNPFFVDELLRTLEGDGILRGVADSWALGDLAAVPVPPLLRQVIAGRLARLAPETERLLAVAAVIGQEVSLAIWAAVGEVAEDDLLGHLERASATRLLEETPAGTGMRFAHALIREVLYAGLPPLRRRGWHRRAGETLADAASPDPDAVAHHFQRAGDPRAAQWLVRAGERAWRAYAWLTAAARYEAALALLDQRGAAAEERAALMLTLAVLYRFADAAHGLPYAEEAARLADGAGDRALAAAAAFDAGHLRTMAGDLRQGLGQMERALPLLEALPAAERARAPIVVVQRVPPEGQADYHRVAVTTMRAHVGRLAEARAGSLSPLTGAPVPAASALARVAALLGQPEEARRYFDRNRAARRAAGRHWEVGLNAVQELRFLTLPYEPERLAERERLVTEAEDAWTRGGGALAAGMPRLAHVWTLLLGGQWDEVGRIAAALRAVRDDQLRLGITGVLAQLARARGDVAGGRALVRAAFPTGPMTAPGNDWYHDATILQGVAALLALDLGDLAEARAWLAAHDRWLAWSGAALGQAEGALGWAAYHRAAGDRASAPRQPLALLAAHRTLGELDLAEGHTADATAHLEAALALAEACAAPYERALTLLALADLHLATRDRNGASLVLAEARALLAPLEARPALARAAALDARLAAPASAVAPTLPFGLTPREADVLRLVAEGLTDAQIAARLFVGRSTVNTHTRAIYGKLGVTSRAAATRLALDHGFR
jgi:DNA-binding CsgD family transcriptional regulator